MRGAQPARSSSVSGDGVRNVVSRNAELDPDPMLWVASSASSWGEQRSEDTGGSRAQTASKGLPAKPTPGAPTEARDASLVAPEVRPRRV